MPEVIPPSPGRIQAAMARAARVAESGTGSLAARDVAALLAHVAGLSEDLAIYSEKVHRSPAYEADCPCGRRLSVRIVATADVARLHAIEKAADAYVTAHQKTSSCVAAPLYDELLAALNADPLEG